jgi:subtilisin family serine protease
MGRSFRRFRLPVVPIRLLAVLCSVIFFSTAVSAQTTSAVPGEFIVKFKTQTGGQSRTNAMARLGVERVRHSPLIGAELVRLRAKKIDQAYVKELLASGAIEYFEPNYVLTVSATSPNDTRFSELWGMNNTGQTGGTPDVDIDAPQAWDLTTGSNTVVVGIVDTGINYNHPDLAENAWRNTGEIAGNGRDDDGNGVIDDVYGYNAITHSGDPSDDHGHGSHCSGTIGGVGQNGVGVAGVNWRVKLMGLKFLGADGSGTTDAAIDAINYAVTMRQRGVNIRVLSNSWGGGGASQALGEAIRAANDAGIVFVAAAGNAASDNDLVPSFPSSYDLPNVVSVAAVDHNGNLASFSNFGLTSVDIAAPGVSILSTTLMSNYQTMSGTSMATPHVSGVAALLLSREPALTPAQVKTRLMTTAKPLAQLNGLIAAPGIVDAYNVLTNTQTPLPHPPTEVRYISSSVAGVAAGDYGQRISTADDEYKIVDTGFSFDFYGASFHRLAVSTNGRVVPLADGQSAPTASDYANALQTGIYSYNDDLYPSPRNGGTYFAVDGEMAVITWVAVPYAYRTSSDPSRDIVIQLRIQQSGRIEFNYIDVTSGDAAYDFGATATVGIAPVTGTAGERITISHNTPAPTVVNNGQAVRFEVKGRRATNDFDGDGISDFIVWRPTSAMWYVLTSATDFDFSKHEAFQLGLPGDQPLVGYWDNDDRADLAVFRPSNGTWYFRTSGSQYSVISSVQWGLPDDLPVTGDYDGDGITDITVYRRSTGMFYVLKSSGGFNRSGALGGNSATAQQVQLGGLGNDVVVGDFTGEGKDSFTTVWQLIRFWSVKDSSGTLRMSLPWGMPGDTPLACAWSEDGNTVADRVAVRVAEDFTLSWFVVADSGGVFTHSFGSLGDIPKCGRNYLGGSDMSVFRPSTGEWFVKSSDEVRTIQFGLPGDISF